MNLSTIVLAPFKQGQRKSGVENGCEQLMKLIHHTKTSLIDQYHNEVTIIKPKQTEYISSLSSPYWFNDYVELFSVLSKDRRLLLGGDHSIGQPSVLASLKIVDDPKNLLVIWIDAHADLNTYDASVTKNYHGMPLAGIMGLEPLWHTNKLSFDMTQFKPLPFENLLYFGIRDIDDFEMSVIKENNIKYTNDIEIMKSLITKKLEENKDLKIHISWDVDSLDPSYLDSTGTIASDGLTPHDITSLFNFCPSDKVIAVDIVEFNPSLGNLEKSESVLSEILFKL